MNQNVLIEKRQNTILTFATFFQITVLALQLLLYKIIGDSNSRVHTIIVLLAAIPMLASFLVWARTNILSAVILYLIVVCVFGCHFILFPENRGYMKQYYFFLFFICLPCCINMFKISDTEIFERILSKLCWFIFLFCEIYFLITLARGGTTNYSMALSYYLLLPCLVFISQFFRNQEFISLLMSIIGIITAFCLGARGPIIAWLLYLFFVFFSTKQKMGLKIIFGSVVVAFIVFYDEFLGIISSFLASRGIISRSQLLLAKGTFLTHDSGRGLIAVRAWDAIAKHPWIGNGIGSDYRIIGDYTHNLFTNIWIHFGYIIGSIILFFLAIIVLRAFKNSKNKDVFWLFFCYGLVPLMFSGTYLESVSFWIFLGYCLNHQNISIVKIRVCTSMK